MNSDKYILLTVDVEDWFQVENFKPWIPFSTWDSRELRVERNVNRLLDLFDSVELGGRPEAGIRKVRRWEGERAGVEQIAEDMELSDDKDLKSGSGEVGKLGNHLVPNPNSQPTSNNTQLTQRSCPQPTHNLHSEADNKQQPTHNLLTKKVKATFFVLGWIAQKLPHLVREIQSRGHEVASHGWNHDLPNAMARDDLENDLTKSKKFLEDILGQPVVGYRAPSFAVNDDILKTIGECGYRYDSSYNSFSLHGRYGHISLNGSGHIGIAHSINENFYELPISNLPLSYLGILAQFRHLNLPWGGGAYFRLFPASIFNSGVKTILRQQDAYVFYMHPWEIDPRQPRVNQASFNFKSRHYINLNKTETRLGDLIVSFDNCQFVTCREYLNSKPGQLI